MKIPCGFDIWGSETLLDFCFLFYMPREGEGRERDKREAGGVRWVGSVPEDPSSPQRLWHFPGWSHLSSLSRSVWRTMHRASPRVVIHFQDF